MNRSSVVSEALNQLQRDYKSPGLCDIDRIEVLTAVLAICEDSHLPLPEWTLDILHNAFTKYRDLEVNSLDEAFGVSTRTSTRRQQFKTRSEAVQPIQAAVYRLTSNGEPIDELLFSTIGEELGMSSSIVRNIYYYGPDRQNWPAKK